MKLSATDRDLLWNKIAEIRDRYPRLPDDAPTDEILDAIEAFTPKEEL